MRATRFPQNSDVSGEGVSGPYGVSHGVTKLGFEAAPNS